MPLTQIEITAEDSFADAIDGIATSFNTIDHYKGPAAEDGRRRHVLIAGRGDRQGLIDALQGLLSQSETARIVLFNVEATIPPEPEEKESDEVVAERRKQAIGATREELYNDVTHGADLDSAYLLQVVLSTIVAAIGMLEDNVAVVIGAMVIAPLLGPNLALSFGAALGDARLMTRAVTTGGVGLAVAISIGVAIGMLDLFPLTANELLSRTEVGLAGVVLALASGAAAALSMSTGLSSALVGVMVAVALLPPTATMGIMLGAGLHNQALGALLLLVVNVASVNFSALVVFLARGVRARTWLERQAARQSALITAASWLILLVVLIGIIVLRDLLT